MDYQKLILAGNITNDAKMLKSKKGDITFAAFNMGIRNSANRATYFPVVVFGKLGESLLQYLVKGRQVMVDGHVELSNMGRFNVVAERVILGVPAQAKEPVATIEKIAEVATAKTPTQ